MMGLIFLFLGFLLALGISLAGVLDFAPSPILFISGALVPAAGYFALYFISSRFRQFVLNLNLRAVTLVEASRVTGFIFFLEYAWGRLPGLFAITTGATDFTVGITSMLVAFKLNFERRYTNARGNLLACFRDAGGPHLRNNGDTDFGNSARASCRRRHQPGYEHVSSKSRAHIPGTGDSDLSSHRAVHPPCPGAPDSRRARDHVLP